MLIPLPLSPDALSDREREAARWHPEREVLLLAAAGAAKVLGAPHVAISGRVTPSASGGEIVSIT